jgi:hypothetical protein
MRAHSASSLAFGFGIVGGFLVSIPICGIVTGLYIAAFSMGQVATGVHNLTDYDIEHYDQ